MWGPANGLHVGLKIAMFGTRQGHRSSRRWRSVDDAESVCIHFELQNQSQAGPVPWAPRQARGRGCESESKENEAADPDPHLMDQKIWGPANGLHVGPRSRCLAPDKDIEAVDVGEASTMQMDDGWGQTSGLKPVQDVRRAPKEKPCHRWRVIDDRAEEENEIFRAWALNRLVAFQFGQPVLKRW